MSFDFWSFVDAGCIRRDRVSPPPQLIDRDRSRFAPTEVAQGVEMVPVIQVRRGEPVSRSDALILNRIVSSGMAHSDGTRRKSGQGSSLSGCELMEESDQSCVPEPQDWDFLRVDDGYYTDGQGIKRKAAQVITVTGTLGCKVNAQGPFVSGVSQCDDVAMLESALGSIPLQHVDRAAIITAIVAVAVIAVDLLSPILPKCALVTNQNPIKTPDQDDAEGWRLATDAIIWTYSGNFNHVRAGQRVDVKYPNGDSVRFLILEVTRDPVPAFRSIKIGRFLDGIPNPSNARC